jgi:hypothetical protein
LVELVLQYVYVIASEGAAETTAQSEEAEEISSEEAAETAAMAEKTRAEEAQSCAIQKN